jgi:hypothetical protein
LLFVFSVFYLPYCFYGIEQIFNGENQKLFRGILNNFDAKANNTVKLKKGE